MLTGKIHKIIYGQDYGFIKCDENGIEYFYHNSMLTRLPRMNEPVKFEPSERSEKGPRCKMVEFLR